MVIQMLGEQAKCWNYQIEEINSHVSVWPTEPGINPSIIHDLENSAKRNLNIYGDYILEPTRIENLEETPRSKGPLTAIFNDIDLICDCWLEYPTKLGLIRSGNFIKNEACKDSARDLELWRFRNDREIDLAVGEMYLSAL
ncbi:uncharacterized protein SOCG_04788 [Schizosaccharomyces octosporus yFS286]|uniref:Uncharacterized protein n=1 Tax=Schizosaccharomyces octosporus (strain yFS286) TaxID=483514 RepID=S9PQX1_SCHOY|nr:uncharacterized protein SOCG_04788 [Schizosaccharomyces octosporus yFS286]EPX70417.1 hypothetical protein SOCG_04788 [Schizosaccharomyces octosporus yFS286]